MLSQGQSVDPIMVPAAVIVQGAPSSSLPSTWRHFPPSLGALLKGFQTSLTFSKGNRQASLCRKILPGQIKKLSTEIIKSCVYSRPLGPGTPSLFPPVLWPVMWRGKWVCPPGERRKSEIFLSRENKRILMSKEPPGALN